MDRLMTRAWVEIDLGALVRNGERFAREADCPLLPMVKADAYGLGAVRVAHALQTLSWGFGVATIEEGEELRRSGLEQPILVFSPLLPQQFDAARRSRLTPVLGDPASIAKWIPTREAWHLMVDTGMNRAGVPWREVATVHDLIRQHPPQGVCTHYHSAQLPNGSRKEQDERFGEVFKNLPVRPELTHAENSPAIEHGTPSRYPIARPGIFLYGVSSGGEPKFEPEPVVAMRGRVVEIRVVREGDTVSYDATWRAPRAGRIATVSLGYADGYRRSLGNRTHALLRGAKIPVVGHVTMDMTMIDVTDRTCNVGEVITLLGRDDKSLITVNDLAAASELSPYEILTGLRARLPRLYVPPAEPA